MARYLRFNHQGADGFGTLDGDTISVHDGDMFAAPTATG
jgi:gentisate 1,2-dioxygenase